MYQDGLALDGLCHTIDVINAKTKYYPIVEGATNKFSYTNSKKQPIIGTGQGSSKSPIIWLFLLDILIKKMH
jgi:hypothetical protein